MGMGEPLENFDAVASAVKGAVHGNCAGTVTRPDPQYVVSGKRNMLLNLPCYWSELAAQAS